MSQLVTGDAVILDVRTAGLASRLLAAALDGLIQGFLFFVLILISVKVSQNEAEAAGLLITSYVLSGLGYPVLVETLMKGRTPGKAALGLRVVRDDAGPIAFRQAFVRGLLGFVVERPGLSFYSVAVICSLARSDGKRLGDVVAGTMVIQERVVAPQAGLIQMPGPLIGWATTLDLSRLSDDLALSVRQFLGRSGQMTEAARAQLGNQLLAAVAAVVTPEAPDGTPPWAYLSAVLAERRRRAEAQHGAAPVAYAPQAPAAAPPPPAAAPSPPPAEGGFAAPF